MSIAEGDQLANRAIAFSHIPLGPHGVLPGRARKNSLAGFDLDKLEIERNQNARLASRILQRAQLRQTVEAAAVDFTHEARPYPSNPTGCCASRIVSGQSRVSASCLAPFSANSNVVKPQPLEEGSRFSNPGPELQRQTNFATELEAEWFLFVRQTKRCDRSAETKHTELLADSRGEESPRGKKGAQDACAIATMFAA